MTTEGLNEITGNFNGWQYVSLATGILFLFFAFLMFFFFLHRAKDRLYSYATVGMLGLALFFMVIGFFRVDYYFRYGDDGTFHQLLISLIFSARPFLFVAVPLSMVFSTGLIVSNIRLIQKEGLLGGNLFAVGFALVVLCADAVTIILELNPLQFMVPNEVKNAWYWLFCYFSCLFIAVVVCATAAALHTPRYDKDYVLILGCSIREDGTLFPLIRNRVEKAIQFVKAQERDNGKKAIFVPTGGKGTYERISEGEAMRDYLIGQGIPKDRILTETESTNTLENMEYARNLIWEKNSNIAFSTTNFHVFRSGMLAEKIGWHIEGMGADTAWYFWPNAFIREFLGLLASSWLGQLAMISLVIVIAYFLTSFI